jgi:hypothetical protein
MNFMDSMQLTHEIHVFELILLLYLVLVIIDPPYGILPTVEWDESAWGEEQFKKCFTEVGKVNSASNYIVAVFSTIEQVRDIVLSFNEVGIKDHTCIVWYKKNAHGQNSNLIHPRLISSVEVLTLGFYGSRGQCRFNYPSKPLEARSNLWSFNTPSKSEICFTETGEMLNPAQKPLSLLRCLIHRHSDPGSTILDLCSGSGTTAVAASSLGRNCVCVERDLNQAAFIKVRLESTNFETGEFLNSADPFIAIEDQELIEIESSQELLHICSSCEKKTNSELLIVCACDNRYCWDCINSSANRTLHCNCGSTVSL